MPAKKDDIQIPIAFIGADEVPIHYANQFVIQHQANEFILTIGQITPPILLGTGDELRSQAESLSYVPVHVVSRIAMTRQRLVELMDALKTNLEAFDSKQSGGSENE